jgi:hypothetical protein
MKLLKSEKLNIPKVYFISEKKELKDIPPGVPFIYADPKMEEYLIRLLEYEVLYQAAVKTGYPFNFKKILEDNGFTDCKRFWYHNPVYIEFFSKEYSDETQMEEFVLLKDQTTKFEDFVKDNSCYVNIEKLKDLNVFPVWLDKIEDAISTNIHNFAVYNNNMYNKKLEGMYGSLDLTSPPKNLIIIDISGSIPKAVSTTCLTLAKNLSESFYADILITGSKSTLYLYEELYTLDVKKVYDDNGMDNDQTYFKELVTGDKKVYKTCIVFGDNHSPCQSWNNEYNKKTSTISIETGKEMCTWKIEKLISFHTGGTSYTAGYAAWFDPKETEKIEDWLTYLN